MTLAHVQKGSNICRAEGCSGRRLTDGDRSRTHPPTTSAAGMKGDPGTSRRATHTHTHARAQTTPLEEVTFDDSQQPPFIGPRVVFGGFVISKGFLFVLFSFCSSLRARRFRAQRLSGPRRTSTRFRVNRRRRRPWA